MCNCLRGRNGADSEDSIYCAKPDQQDSTAESAQLSDTNAPCRRTRCDTKDYQNSRAKLSTLCDVLDETPRTRAEIVADKGAQSDGALMYMLGGALAERSPNQQPSQSQPSTRKKTRGFGALTELIEQSPRTRIGKPAQESLENDLADMQVSILVEEQATLASTDSEVGLNDENQQAHEATEDLDDSGL